MDNSNEYVEYYEDFDRERTIDYIEESLKKYVIITVNTFLEDNKLTEILKK